MHKCTVHICHATITHKRIQIRGVAIVITTTRAVHIAETCHRQGFIPVCGLGGIGSIVEAVIMIVVVGIGTIQP